MTYSNTILIPPNYLAAAVLRGIQRGPKAVGQWTPMTKSLYWAEFARICQSVRMYCVPAQFTYIRQKAHYILHNPSTHHLTLPPTTPKPFLSYATLNLSGFILSNYN